MTVAAVILVASEDEALAAIDGQPAVRRLVDLAWSGGALPIVVMTADLGGQVSTALAGAPVTLAAPPPGSGAAGAIVRGLEVALGQVRDTDGVITWPAAHVWVGPETVTSLIEAHGVAPEVMIIPTWEGAPGWPVLVPATEVAALRSLSSGRSPGDAIAALGAAGVGTWPVSLGDPGSILDGATPREALPDYQGPLAPVSGHAHEWGAAVADLPADAPLEGPALAPWPGPADETG